MSTTPEGKVKELIKRFLQQHGLFPAGAKAWFLGVYALGWYYMPVQSGIGVSGIPDFMGHYRGRLFGIEAKAPDEKPTPNQAMRHSEIRASGAVVFVVDGADSLHAVQAWMKAMDDLT